MTKAPIGRLGSRCPRSTHAYRPDDRAEWISFEHGFIDGPAPSSLRSQFLRVLASYRLELPLVGLCFRLDRYKLAVRSYSYQLTCKTQASYRYLLVTNE